MNLEKDRKIVIMIPHSDDELIATLSVINRHPNKENIFCITLVNEPIIQNFINGHAPELTYGTNQINQLLSNFGIKPNQCIRVHKTLDVLEHCFSILSLVNPEEVYCPAKEDGHDDHELFHNITKRIQRKLNYKVYGYIIHVAEENRPVADHFIELTPEEQELKEKLRREIYAEKVDVPVFMKMKFGRMEEFYDS